MQSRIASPLSSKIRNQLVDNQIKVALAIFLAVSGTATIGTACGDTVTWQWEATVYEAGFVTSQTIDLPWDVSVGDTITGTFTVNYADAGVDRVPGVKVYETQPLDNVTVELDGVEVWLDQYTTKNNIIIDDQPSFNPDFEKIAINRFSRGDPRFPDVAVDGGMSFVAPTGADLIHDAEVPTAFDLPNFSSADFGMFIGNTEPAVQYNFGARIISLRQRSTTITIDINPWVPNIVSLRPRSGLVSVAILSDEGFDAPYKVQKDSLTFGVTGDEQSLAFCGRWPRDVNNDGYTDIICHFYKQDTGFQCGDTEGILKGETTAGLPIEGRDSLRIVPCR